MATMEDAALFAADRYGRPDGTPHNVQDVADAYEAHSYRNMLYSLGAGDDMLDLANRQWNAITRLYDDGVPLAQRNPSIRSSASSCTTSTTGLVDAGRSLGLNYDWFR